MALVKNFDPEVTMGADSLHVTGNSDEIKELEGTDLISRSVALLQGDSFASSLTPPDLFKWSGDVPLGGVVFQTGECTAIGTETYAVDPDVNPLAIATTLTVTWVQTVKIVKA